MTEITAEILRKRIRKENKNISYFREPCIESKFVRSLCEALLAKLEEDESRAERAKQALVDLQKIIEKDSWNTERLHANMDSFVEDLLLKECPEYQKVIDLVNEQEVWYA